MALKALLDHRAEARPLDGAGMQELLVLSALAALSYGPAAVQRDSCPFAVTCDGCRNPARSAANASGCDPPSN
jgi:hypothetical protein